MSWPIVVIGAILFLCLIALADAGVALVGLNAKLRSLQADLTNIESQLEDGELSAARRSAGEALRAGSEAVEAAKRPTLQLATELPVLQRDATAIRSLAVAGRRSAEAAEHVVDAAESLDLSAGGVPEGLYDDGRVLLDTAERAAISVQLAERAALEGALELEGVDPHLAVLREPIETARARLTEGIRRLNTAGVAFDLMGSMLGTNRGRDYLLLFQAPGEARATGGFAGFAGALSADDGLLELDEVLPLRDIQPRTIRPVKAPRWFAEAYSVQGALTEWRQANVAPNFPAVSEIYLEMYERGTGRTLDGVVAMDPFALASLMNATGPIETTAPARTVRPDEAAEVILRDSYVELSTEQQNRFLTQIVERFWQKVGDGEVDLADFADALDRSIDRQHIKVYSAHSGDAQKLAALGLDGHYVTAGSVTQMAFNNNYGANKIDYFLHRRVTTVIDLRSDGSAAVTTTLELDNRAPTGPPSVLIGQGNEIPVGTNRMMINLLMPPSSTVEGFEVGGEAREPFLYRDRDSPVVWDLLEIPAGNSETVHVSYTIPAAMLDTGDGSEFHFVLFPQTTVNPDAFSLTVHAPPGAAIANGGDFDRTTETSITQRGRLEEPQDIRVRMTSP